MDEAGRIARYAPEGDAEGLAAYALHRKAFAAFRAEFVARHDRPPVPEEEDAFLLGEETAARIEAYRRDVRALAKKTPASASPFRLGWPYFGQWGAPPATPDPDAPVNWRGLAGRFALLLLAVIATAVLLRSLFVKV